MSASAYDAAVLEDTPILYWKCNESSGTTLTDASGNGNDGTLSGNYTLNYEPFDLRLPTQSGTLDLNRTGTRNGYAYINPVPADWPVASATFEMWYRDTTYSPTPDGAGIFSYCAGAPNTGNNWMLWWDVQGEYQLHVAESDRADGFESGGVSPWASVNAPKHLAVTWTASTGIAKLYINGNLVDQMYDVDWGTSMAGNGAFVVGQDQDSVLGGFVAAQAFAAVVSNIAVYDTVLSEERIKAHWDAHAADAYREYYDTTPDVGSTVVTDTVAPTVYDFSPGTALSRTTSVTFKVTDDNIDDLGVEIWAEFDSRSEMIYANGASSVNYTVAVTETRVGATYDRYTITPLGAGWVGDFTLAVLARDTANTTYEENSFTISTADEYPPLMDPYT